MQERPADWYPPENYHVMLGGTTGSGKSRLSKLLLSLTPRALVLDRQGEYRDGEVFTDPLEVVEFWRADIRRDWHVIFRHDSTAANLALADLLVQWQAKDWTLPPVGVWMEEASYYSEPGRGGISPALERMYTKGRHARVSVLTIVQRWTQVNEIIRDQSRAWIFFRMESVPSTVSERVRRSDLDKIANLSLANQSSEPERDINYIVSPSWEDPVARWAETLRRR